MDHHRQSTVYHDIKKQERRITMGGLKVFEIILKAASLLVAAAMSVVKFIGIIGKLAPAKA